jgi:8-hydroxy-5-deazaflavin:NADPH oxidoreductase
MATIGLIGSGKVGTNISLAAIAAGYDVVLSNSRGPQTLSDLVKRLGSHAKAGTAEEAAEMGDFAVVAIPLPGVDRVPVEPLAGKVVLCTINYFPQRFGNVASIDDGTTTAPGVLQAHLPASSVVRAFNMVDAEDIPTDGHPVGDPSRRALAVAGDNSDAKRVVAKLYNEFGFDALDIGPLAESWRLDPGQPAFVVKQNLEQLRTNVANARFMTAASRPQPRYGA